MCTVWFSLCRLLNTTADCFKINNLLYIISLYFFWIPFAILWCWACRYKHNLHIAGKFLILTHLSTTCITNVSALNKSLVKLLLSPMLNYVQRLSLSHFNWTMLPNKTLLSVVSGLIYGQPKLFVPLPPTALQPSKNLLSFPLKGIPALPFTAPSRW